MLESAEGRGMLYVVTVSVAFLLWFLIKWLIIERQRYPPGPFRLPFLGNVFQVDQAYPHKSFVELTKKYGPVYTVWLPGPIVVLASHEVLKEANSLYPQQISGRPQGFLYGIFSKHQKDGDGIILCQGDKWMAQRRFALKTFHNFGMGKRVMESKINYHKNLLLKRLSGLCDTDTRIGVVDLHLHIGYCVGNIINDLVMGRFYHFGEPEFLKFKKLIDNTLEGFASASMQLVNMYPFLRFFVPYYRTYVKEGFEIQEFFLEEIEKHEAVFDPNSEPTNFIDAYLADIKQGKEKYLNKLTLALDAGDLWTGGMETTVTTVRWGIMYLIHHPGIQEALQLELDAVLDLNQPSTNQRQDLHYMNAVLDEIQRIVNVLPWGIPHQTLEEVQINGFRIPVGTTVMPQVGAVHHDEKNFPDPEVFNPERFLDKHGTYKKHPKLSAFGLGKRSCLGEALARMELFLIFAGLVQNFSFHPYQDQYPSLERTPGMTSVPKPYLCEIRQRRSFLITDNPEIDS